MRLGRVIWPLDEIRQVSIKASYAFLFRKVKQVRMTVSSLSFITRAEEFSFFVRPLEQQEGQEIIEIRLGNLLHQIGRHGRKLRDNLFIDVLFVHANFLSLRIG